MVNPCVLCNPQLSTVPEEFEQQVPSVFPSCAVTRGMAWKENELTHTIGSDDDEIRCGCQSEVDDPSQNGQVPREGNELPQQLDGSPALSQEQRPLN